MYLTEGKSVNHPFSLYVNDKNVLKYFYLPRLYLCINFTVLVCEEEERDREINGDFYAHLHWNCVTKICHVTWNRYKCHPISLISRINVT